jgi:hypothetical protein
MTPLFLRARRGAIGAGLSMAFGLAAPGCAVLDETQGPVARYTQTSSLKDPYARAAVPSAKPRLADKPAAERKAADTGAADRPVDNRLTVASIPPPTPKLQPANETACVNVEDCASVLKAMIEDPERGWMTRSADATTLANGVRLFAYRALRPKLSCIELTTAFHEVSIGMAAFAGPVAGLAPHQVERARLLTAQVEVELKLERAQRCNATGQAIDIRQGALPELGADGRPSAPTRELR